MSEKPLFIPLKTQYYEEFCRGTKQTEFRRYNNYWNDTSCAIGRRVTLSKGYGKKHRKEGIIVGFEVVRVGSDLWNELYSQSDTEAWCACYPEDDVAACIKIQLIETQPQ